MSDDEIGTIGFYGEFPEGWSEEKKAAMRLIEDALIAEQRQEGES